MVTLLIVPFGSIARLAAEPVAMALLIAWFAVGMRYLGNFGRFGDFTFGLYLWHFPLIQTFISLNLFEGNPFVTLAGLLSILLALAYVSWHWLEKPFLARDSHYVRAEHEDDPGSPGSARTV
jgi:peptidoglycan/LPS O-acetylase OafA/YrhL